MIDPLSLASAAVNLAKAFGDVAHYIAKITKVDQAIETLQKEIDSLSKVLSSIHVHIPKAGSFAITSRTDEKHWENIWQAMEDSKDTLHRLNKIVEDVNKTRGNIFRKGLQQFKMDWKSGDVALLLREVSSCRQVMDMSLQIIIYISVAQGGQDVSRLNSKLEEMGRKLDHFFTTFRNEPHGAVVGIVRNTHRRILDNHRNCAISTKRFHRVALSVASRSSAMNFGSDTGSVVGLTRQREAWIESWMENLAQSHLDPNEKSVSPNVTEILDDVPDQNMNTDLAFVKIHHQRKAAVDCIKREQYLKAEKLLRIVMKGSEQTYGAAYEWRESSMELLAKSCRGQQKFEEAEHVLLQILSDRSEPERRKDELDTMHALAEVYLDKYNRDKSNEDESADREWTNAEHYCKKAVDGKNAAYGQHDPSFHLSVSLLIQIYEAKGGDHELEVEGYRPMLPADYWSKERQAIEQLKALGPEGGASSIGSEIFSTLLPEECQDRWEEIKENMRRRTDGLAGSGFGYTLLHAVAEFGDDVALLRILEEETAIDTKDGNGQTPLYLAAAKGRESTVQILIDHRAKVNLGEDNRKTPLMIAAENGHQKVVLQLVDARASVRAKDELQWTALHYAAFSGATDVARVLLQSEAEVDVQGASNKTPLHIAASRGHESFVRLLVRNEAKVSAKTRESDTPIKLAQKYHHDNVVQFLQGCLPRRKKLIG